jgi:acyl-coenzyme A synthetase/AMP-(fatty) acid ligase
MKVEGGSLRIRSPRNARGYLGPGAPPLAGEDGFVDTGDMVEWRNGRYHFVGRRGGVINVGGQKVHPEEVEAALNRHPAVRMSLVRPRKSPITGAIVVADIVAAPGIAADAALAEDILEACRHWLPRYKVPAQLRFVPGLEVSGSGKLRRADA